MPELPEVETVKRGLEKELVGLKIVSFNLLYPRLLKTDKETLEKNAVDSTIVSLSRKGKYLIINLSSSYSLLFHFRMEGKLFHLSDLESNLNKHVSIYFTLNDGSYLIFNDTRKFGVMYLVKTEGMEYEEPLCKVGKEPWDIYSPQYLLNAFKKDNRAIKEAIMDQTIIAGLGNIYADEVLFASNINPFKKAKEMSEKDVSNIVSNSRIILDQAIQNRGSTVRSYHPSKGVSGGMQNFLKVYGREHLACYNCDTVIEKRYLGGRGTCYCPKCQHVKPSLALTGKIASGKSLVLSMLAKLGFKVASADEIVHELYKDQKYLNKLKDKFPVVFDEKGLNKKLVIENMMSDKKFRRNYQNFIWSEVKDKINSFMIDNSEDYKAIEVPLLYEAKMDKDFTYIIGVETDRQVDFLKKRNDEDPRKRLQMNSINTYDIHRHEMDFIVSNKQDEGDLYSQVLSIVKAIKEKWD